MKEIIQKIMKNQCNNRRRNEENMVAERENIQVTEEKELLQQRTQGSRNEMEIVFDAVSCNESFARVAVAAFITHLNPTLEELAGYQDRSIGGSNQCHYPWIRESVRLYESWGDAPGVQHYPSGKGKTALHS